MRTAFWTGIVAAVGLLAGCSGESAPQGHIAGREEELREVWQMYKDHLDARKRPPAKLQDLVPYEPAAINGFGALRDDRVVLLWGGSATAGQPPRVLAYEKEVPEKGGAVLLQDGTVKAMTADEFKSAPKAGK
ncbi:MAG TPA: hypothetical protein VM533_03860 [Fimbriiglobus sp.]|jgi:hypothetical protein|nr:hypothetical protein [Fimbriiglobus sp.]